LLYWCKRYQTEPSGIITREVLQKETKYGIAKNGLTVKELENQNPTVKNGLRVGDKLSIQLIMSPYKIM
jgi:hypothetical protein